MLVWNFIRTINDSIVYILYFWRKSCILKVEKHGVLSQKHCNVVFPPTSYYFHHHFCVSWVNTKLLGAYAKFLEEKKKVLQANAMFLGWTQTFCEWDMCDYWVPFSPGESGDLWRFVNYWHVVMTGHLLEGLSVIFRIYFTYSVLSFLWKLVSAVE